MSGVKPLSIENGRIKESNQTTGGTDITSSSPEIVITEQSPGNFVVGFNAELAKLPNLALDLVAGEAISALKAIYIALDGKAYKANNEDSFPKALAAGVAINAATTGGTVSVLIYGIMEDAAWNWTANDLLFLDVNGNITATPPTIGYQVTLAKALTSKKILISIKDPIELL